MKFLLGINGLGWLLQLFMLSIKHDKGVMFTSLTQVLDVSGKHAWKWFNTVTCKYLYMQAKISNIKLISGPSWSNRGLSSWTGCTEFRGYGSSGPESGGSKYESR